MNPKRIATVFIGAEIGLAALFGIEGASGHMTGIAYAETGSECFDEAWQPIECPPDEILLSEIHNPNLLPVCAQEDCSDQPNQVGMWLDDDTGNWYLELGESQTFLVVDDTVAPWRHE